jgi:hypothetical protein
VLTAENLRLMPSSTNSGSVGKPPERPPRWLGVGRFHLWPIVMRGRDVDDAYDMPDRPGGRSIAGSRGAATSGAFEIYKDKAGEFRYASRQLSGRASLAVGATRRWITPGLDRGRQASRCGRQS